MRETTFDEEMAVLKFAQKAALNFEQDQNLLSFTNSAIEAGCLFALRYGLGNDCVVVFRLARDFVPIDFQQIIPSPETSSVGLAIEKTEDGIHRHIPETSPGLAQPTIRLSP